MPATAAYDFDVPCAGITLSNCALSNPTHAKSPSPLTRHLQIVAQTRLREIHQVGDRKKSIHLDANLSGLG